MNSEFCLVVTKMEARSRRSSEQLIDLSHIN
jgi:hypothetical protein